MKKTLAMLLALVMVFALCACGQTAAPAPAAPAETAAAEAPADEAAAPETEASPLANVKVGMICLHGEASPYDVNFYEAAQKTFTELGMDLDTQFILKLNVPEGNECYDTAADMVDDGCNIVFSDSYGHEPFMIQAAKDFPEVLFVSATGDRAHTEGLPNFVNAFADIYMGRYLAGVAAGLKLNEMIENGDFTAEEAKIGYVGAKPYAEIVSGFTSFYLGARSVCPTATMDVIYSGEWYDEPGEKECANKLMAGGCKLISQHADSMGAPTACETAGVPNVSYNVSTIAACPNTYVVASRINWGVYYTYLVNTVAAGETVATDWEGTLADGAVEILEINDAAAAAGTAEKLEEVKAALIDGSVKVFDLSTFTVEGETVTSFMANVDNTDDTYSHETEAVVDGYIAESVFRSAPYFDLAIDGITILK